MSADLTELDELKRLAAEATPGGWESVATRYATEKFDVCGPAGTLAIVSAEADARFIAAASPDKVLALIAEVERLRRIEEAAREYRKHQDGEAWLALRAALAKDGGER